MVTIEQKDQYTIDDLRQIMALLRAPDGCPWDRVQSHASIRRNMIEEAYEAVDAIDRSDRTDMIEELGDAFTAEKQRYAAKSAQPMNREQRRAQAKKNRHKPPVSYPAPPAARMVERVDAQVSAKKKTEQLIDARQAVNALRDDPDAMQQLAEYALQLASERHV